jgi:hypothetical protein
MAFDYGMTMVTRGLTNADELADWARGEGFDDLVPSAWHVSIIRAYAGMALDRSPLVLRPSSRRIVATMGHFTALIIRSSKLTIRHHAHRRAGGSWDFASYLPHISFAVRDRRDLRQVLPYRGYLLLGGETVQWPDEVGLR